MILHGIHRSLERRLRELEARLEALAPPETEAETARRLELSKAALEGRDVADLDGEELELFEKVKGSVWIFEELVSEGTITPTGEPAGADDPHDMV